MEIDNKAKKILNELLTNSRQSYRQIAKKVGVSVATVMHRVQELERKGIIKKYSAIVDYEALGYEFEAIIDVRVTKGNVVSLEKKMKHLHNVCAIYDNTGHFDMTIVARFQSRRSMDALLKKVQSYDFVERTETKTILRTIKEESVML